MIINKITSYATIEMEVLDFTKQPNNWIYISGAIFIFWTITCFILFMKNKELNKIKNLIYTGERRYKS